MYKCEWNPTPEVMELLQYALMASTNGPSTPPSTDADGPAQIRRPSMVVTGKNSDAARQHVVETHLASGTALTITLVLMQPGKCWVVGEVLAEWGKTLMQVTLAGACHCVDVRQAITDCCRSGDGGSQSAVGDQAGSGAASDAGQGADGCTAVEPAGRDGQAGRVCVSECHL